MPSLSREAVCRPQWMSVLLSCPHRCHENSTIRFLSILNLRMSLAEGTQGAPLLLAVILSKQTIKYPKTLRTPLNCSLEITLCL